jgi:hypothetical protein
MAKKLEEGDEERDRYVETLSKFERLAHGIRPPSCVQIFERPLREIQEYLGCGLRPLVTQMHQHLTIGGELSRVDETRDNWRDKWQFHFDLWPEFGGREIYVETRFVNADDIDDRVIFIVSVHPPQDVTWSAWTQK